MKRSEVAARLAALGIENAEGEARMIFDALGQTDNSLDPDSDRLGIDPHRLAEVIFRRGQHQPLQYLLGVAWFWREEYEVSPACLIPRSDTECLVEYAIRSLPQNACFIDMCTGSGCVAISVLASRPDCRCYAIDNSPATLEIAKRNAERNGVAHRVTFLLEDAFGFIPKEKCNGFFSNPPYIQKNVIPTLSREVLCEPVSALDGGDDGLDFYRHFCKNIRQYIYNEGICAFEIGYDQGEALISLAEANGLSCRIQKDLGGCDRLAILTLNP